MPQPVLKERLTLLSLEDVETELGRGREWVKVGNIYGELIDHGSERVDGEGVTTGLESVSFTIRHRKLTGENSVRWGGMEYRIESVDHSADRRWTTIRATADKMTGVLK